MVVGAERLKHLVNNETSGPIFKNENDPRITKVGKFLRRTSLDELPQFTERAARGDEFSRYPSTH
jgi:lipopolysaccharide/colanic/teichoic acid biosynthesis glycosyltransferase